jgi:hypothetical protein
VTEQKKIEAESEDRKGREEKAEDVRSKADKASLLSQLR